MLEVSSKEDIFQFGINLSSNKFLKMVIVPGSISLNELGNWGKVKKFWFNPKRFFIDPAQLENVINLEIDVDKIPENFAMEQICQDLTNLETLSLQFITPTANLKSVLILNFKQLKDIEVVGKIKFDDLFDILHTIGNMKTLKISGSLDIVYDNIDLDKETTMNVFKQAMKIIKEKISSRIGEDTFQVHEKQHDLIIDFTGYLRAKCKK